MEQVESDPIKQKRKYIAFCGMILGMFMAVLDIQIVASSLPVIGGGLSATTDELSWIQTAYIIAEVVVIPLTGFLARLLSTRILYVIATIGFTIMSIACASAYNLESMIMARALQGLFGGAMIPTIFGIIYIIFDDKERSTMVVVIGLVVTLAPTLGPTIGGYITEALSWHYMFLLNVIPGIIVSSIVYFYADFDKPDHSLLENFDYLGIFLLSTSVGSLQYVLEEGSRKDWMQDELILSLTIYVFFAVLILIYHELTTKKLVLDLRAFSNRNFTMGCMLSAILGVGLFGSVFLLPIFLGKIASYNTIQIGAVMGLMGISQFFAAPIAGTCMRKNMDRRLMMFFGMSMFAFASYINSFMTDNTRFADLILPQLIRGFSLMFCFIPINDLTLGALPKHQVQDASGLYNLMRNLGGAFGLAIINSKITDNTIINRDILASGISKTGILPQYYTEMIGGSISYMVPDYETGALSVLNNILFRESFIISINNVYAYISVLLICATILITFIRNIKKSVKNAH